MAIDLSKVFKANVKAIRMSSGDDVNKTEILNEQLLKKTSKKSKDSFTKDAKNIVTNITILKNFLNENKRFYVQPNYLVQSNDNVSDVDYQNFEDQAESIIKKCADTIRSLKEKTYKQIYTSQQKHHLDNVFYLMDKYLKDVCKIYGEQKAIRVKRKVDLKKFSQLCSNEISRMIKEEARVKKDLNEPLREEIEKSHEKKFNIENHLTEQELKELEKENELLYDNLSIQNEEVKNIESQVIEVSRLTQIFTENIVSQVETVDRIQKSTVETNENLTLGNENIKEAMKKNAALRLWILFIIIVLSFTLLFLDWYND